MPTFSIEKISTLMAILFYFQWSKFWLFLQECWWAREASPGRESIHQPTGEVDNFADVACDWIFWSLMFIWKIWFSKIGFQGIDPLSLDMLAKEGIMALRRAKRRNMERYCNVFAFILHTSANACMHTHTHTHTHLIVSICINVIITPSTVIVVILGNIVLNIDYCLL